MQTGRNEVDRQKGTVEESIAAHKPDVTQVEKFLEYLHGRVGVKLRTERFWLETLWVLEEELKLAIKEGVFDTNKQEGGFW